MSSKKFKMRRDPGSPKVSDLIGFFENITKNNRSSPNVSQLENSITKSPEKKSNVSAQWEHLTKTPENTNLNSSGRKNSPKKSDSSPLQDGSFTIIPEQLDFNTSQSEIILITTPENNEYQRSSGKDTIKNELYQINHDYYKLDETTPESAIETRSGNLAEVRQKALAVLQNYESILKESILVHECDTSKKSNSHDESFEFIMMESNQTLLRENENNRRRSKDLQPTSSTMIQNTDKDCRTDSSYFSNDEDESEDGNSRVNSMYVGLDSFYELDDYFCVKSPIIKDAPIYENITIKFNVMEGERIIELQKHNENCEAEANVRDKCDDENVANKIGRISKTRKEYIIEELVKTEGSYIKNLGYICKYYIDYMKQHGVTQYKDIFGNVENIYLESEIFYEDLISCGGSHEDIGKTFIRHKNLFNRYPSYCKNKKRSQRLMMQKYYRDIIQERETSINDLLGLSSYLLAPIQRLAKYELLLKNLYKYLKDQDVETKELQSAILLIQRISRTGNDIIILDSIENNNFSVNNTGEFIDKESFKMHSPKKLDVIMFLFQKVIIFTIQNEKNSDSFIFYTYIPVDSLSRKSEAGSVIFTLEDFYRRKKHKDPEFILEAKSLAIKNSWIKKIDDILWKQLLKYKDEASQHINAVSINCDKSDTNQIAETSDNTSSDNISITNTSI